NPQRRQQTLIAAIRSHLQPALWKKTLIVIEICYSSTCATRTTDQEVSTKNNHSDDCNDLNNRKPKFCLTVHPDRSQVDSIDNYKKEQTRRPQRYFRPPKLYIDTYCRQLRHTAQDVQYPIIPPRSKAGKGSPIFIGKEAEAS